MACSLAMDQASLRVSQAERATQENGGDPTLTLELEQATAELDTLHAHAGTLKIVGISKKDNFFVTKN